jgi:hypothetical protein
MRHEWHAVRIRAPRWGRRGGPAGPSLKKPALPRTERRATFSSPGNIFSNAPPSPSRPRSARSPAERTPPSRPPSTNPARIVPVSPWRIPSIKTFQNNNLYHFNNIPSSSESRTGSHAIPRPRYAAGFFVRRRKLRRDGTKCDAAGASAWRAPDPFSCGYEPRAPWNERDDFIQRREVPDAPARAHDVRRSAPLWVFLRA